MVQSQIDERHYRMIICVEWVVFVFVWLVVIFFSGTNSISHREVTTSRVMTTFANLFRFKTWFFGVEASDVFIGGIQPPEIESWLQSTLPLDHKVVHAAYVTTTVCRDHLPSVSAHFVMCTRERRDVVGEDTTSPTPHRHSQPTCHFHSGTV